MILLLLAQAAKGDELQPEDDSQEIILLDPYDPSMPAVSTETVYLAEIDSVADSQSQVAGELREGMNWAPSDWGLAPSYPTLHWSGFLQLDSGWVSQDETLTESVGNFNSETGLRRVRLRVDGKVRENTGYVVDLDFAASGHPSFRDVALRFHSLPVLGNVQFGYFIQPFGMDAATSGRELLFMERQAPFALTPFRQTGISAYRSLGSDRGTYSMSAYQFPTNSYGVNQGDSGGWAFATRSTFLLVDKGDRFLHLGMGYSFGDPSNNEVQYAIAPGFFVTDPTDAEGSDVPVFVDTGKIPTHLFNLFNWELAGRWGRAHFQSEFRFATVDQIGGPTPIFPAAYIQCGWSLTGEVAPYNRDRGVFTGVEPVRDFEWGKGGGAWEVTFGWSWIDLDSENIAGGSMQSLVFGLNWYASKYARFSFNAIPTIVDDPTFGRGKGMIAASRVQLQF